MCLCVCVCVCVRACMRPCMHVCMCVSAGVGRSRRTTCRSPETALPAATGTCLTGPTSTDCRPAVSNDAQRRAVTVTPAPASPLRNHFPFKLRFHLPVIVKSVAAQTPSTKFPHAPLTGANGGPSYKLDYIKKPTLTCGLLTNQTQSIQIKVQGKQLTSCQSP